jgi:tyrosyl-tRNA synthetase
LIEQGGASINEQKVTDSKQMVDLGWVKDGHLLLKAGKKRYFKISVR